MATDQGRAAPKAIANGEAVVEPEALPRSVTIARRGVRTADEALRFTSALIGDAMVGDVKDRTAGVALRGVGVLLRLNDAKQKYNEGRDFVMVPSAGAGDDDRARRLELLEAELKELRAAQS